MNRPEVQTKAQTATDGACSDPTCAYRAEIEMGYWIEPNSVLLRDTPEAVEELTDAIMAESAPPYGPEDRWVAGGLALRVIGRLRRA